MNGRIARKIRKRINAHEATCPRMRGHGYTEEQRRRAVQILHPRAQLPMIDLPPGDSGNLMRDVDYFLGLLAKGITPPLPPRIEVTADPDDPTKLYAKVSNIPASFFIGMSAGEMRARGYLPGPPASVPDCAVLKRQLDGRVAFDWIVLDFILTPTGAEFPPDTCQHGYVPNCRACESEANARDEAEPTPSS